MKAAAHRHLAAAKLLENTHRRDVAGYLFGIAAECALKTLMLSLGMRPLARDQRWNDPFYAHFKELKTLIRDQCDGRRHQDLLRYATDGRFMEHWDVTMRYSDGKLIADAWVTRWAEQATDVIGEI
ncbi:hypothetical protein CK231_26505 [Mesorhizobium loti]|uniref:HEPN domain-containing protein n=2 Tax=Mesorhizobium TaxID=68287 RepID=A0A1A5I829_RHILI|nr:hypothetical protein BAE41_18070 [Mesorhizobium loti]QGX79352.1 hypothetical protein EB234_22590 [Mesorhizobium japonicum R7A]OBP75379.1 hypothetical protein BAE42_07300 [Mesorhizobium loti]OBP76793.1 hypothetical protein BAE39_11970 [Mesorhizobium loti]OBP86508.1 hypothetical protein BAE38_18080 [Mesorhizobium loti]